jgi:hypothetical protein
MKPTNLACAIAVLSLHREARDWTDEAVAADLLTQLGLDATGEATNARPVVDPNMVTEDQVTAAEAAAKDATEKAKEARDQLTAQQNANAAQQSADAPAPTPDVAQAFPNAPQSADPAPATAGVATFPTAAPTPMAGAPSAPPSFPNATNPGGMDKGPEVGPAA